MFASVLSSSRRASLEKDPLLGVGSSFTRFAFSSGPSSSSSAFLFREAVSLSGDFDSFETFEDFGEISEVFVGEEGDFTDFLGLLGGESFSGVLEVSEGELFREFSLGEGELFTEFSLSAGELFKDFWVVGEGEDFREVLGLDLVGVRDLVGVVDGDDFSGVLFFSGVVFEKKELSEDCIFKPPNLVLI